MKPIPILFSGPMVRSILGGAKTVTRRTNLNRWPVGARLWVREAFAMTPDGPVFRADAFTITPDGPVFRDDVAGGAGRKWKPGIHMPAAICRLRLLVTDVRVEPLDALTDADAVLEGVAWDAGLGLWRIPGTELMARTPSDAFRLLWDKINGVRLPWVRNPDVARIAFEVIHGE